MISIIIPVYNSERIIDKLLSQIQAQTYHDYEVITVNDGSTDNSGNILDSYADKDSRFVSYSTENRGASSARNYGLSKANGEFITFIDSDDFIDEDYLENLFHAIDDTIDLVICGYRYPDGRKRIQYEHSETINRNKFVDRVFLNDIWDNLGPFCKLYRKSIIDRNNITFPELMTRSEDKAFNLQYITECQNIRLIPYNGYVYNLTPTGLYSRQLTIEQACNIIVGTKRMFLNTENALGCSQTETRLKEFSLNIAYNWLISSIYNINNQHITPPRIKYTSRVDILKTNIDRHQYLEHSIPYSFKIRLELIVLRYFGWAGFDIFKSILKLLK